MLFYGRLKNLRGEELKAAVVDGLKQVRALSLSPSPTLFLFLSVLVREHACRFASRCGWRGGWVGGAGLPLCAVLYPALQYALVLRVRM